MLNAEHKRIVVVPPASYFQPLIVRGRTHNKAAEQVQWAVAAHYSALQIAHIVAAADNRQAQSLSPVRPFAFLVPVASQCLVALVKYQWQ